jgi:hypothetical protein
MAVIIDLPNGKSVAAIVTNDNQSLASRLACVPVPDQASHHSCRRWLKGEG